MQEGLTPLSQLQLAAFVFPVIALVVNFAINSVDKEDHWLYRYFVGALGMTALVPALIVLGIVVIGFWIQVAVPDVFQYLLLSLLAMGILTIGVLINEVFRGLDADEDDAFKLSVGLGSAVVILMAFLYLFL